MMREDLTFGYYSDFVGSHTIDYKIDMSILMVKEIKVFVF